MVTSDEIMAEVEGRTICTNFLDTVAAHPEAIAVRWRNPDESWGEWSFRDLAHRVARVAAALRAHEVAPGDRVVLMMRNIPEFHVLDLAVSFCGATPVSIYNSSSPEQVQYLVEHSGAVLGVVEDVGFLERFLKVRDEVPGLRTLAVLRDPDAIAPGDVRRVDDWLHHEPLDLATAVADCQIDQLATMIYTSGTTGPPKGVMLTHRNLVWTVECLKRAMPFDSYVGKRVVSYLPMAHIAERMTSHYMGVSVGYEITTCPDPAQIATYLKEVRPNVVFGVPRVWEKIYAGVNAALGADPAKKAQFDDGVAAATPIVERLDWGTATDEDRATWEFLDAAAFGPVRELIGLDQVDAAITGAAPIPADILRWFRAIGVPLSEIYGMSESSGPMTWTGTRVKPGTVGPAVPGVEVRLADDGEIVCRGGNVFAGYYGAPDKTAEALDDDGWLHSGDIGVIDADGYVRIVDRKKELIITAGGKNISPANLEAALKMIPIVGQACAIGDNRPFVSALVVLDPEVAPVWAQANEIEFADLADLASKPEVVDEIHRALEGVMAQFNNAERVKKVSIIGEEWMPDSDVLTPTSKLKRRGIHARYEAEIEAMYGG